MELEVLKDEVRIDVYLKEILDLSRSKIQKLIETENILVNGKVVNNHYLLHSGDKIKVLKTYEDPYLDLKPSSNSVSVVYENTDLLVINKESGLVVHPAPGNYEDTLVNRLIGRFELSNNSYRPGIVHRLDKDTSGLMLVAKNDETHEKLAKMIQEKKVERFYLALVEGVILNDTGTIDAPIGRDPKNRERMMVTSINSKEAITHFKVLERYQNYTLLECKLETGRTHQIRVHMAYINHPVVNDPVYSRFVFDKGFGQLLHSYKIRFKNPRDLKLLEFKVDPPQEFMGILKSVVSK